MNLKHMLADLSHRFSDRTAISRQGRSLSYAELDEESNRVANALLKMGIEKGDRIALLLNNSLEFVVTYFGIVKTGAIACPFDPKYKIDELTALFADCEPRVLASERTVLEPLSPCLDRFKTIERVIDLSSELQGKFLTYREIVSSSPEIPVAVEPDDEDIAHIVYTAGPSLHPHGCALTHRSVQMESIISAEGFCMTADDNVLLFALPLHHSAGLVILLTTALSQGAKVVMLDGLSMPALTEAIEKDKITILIGVPFIFELLVREAQEAGIKHDLRSLRLCASGGSAVSIDLTERFKKLFGYTIAQFWGLSEATAHVTCQLLDGNDVPGSIGPPLTGWEVRAVDECGHELPPNREGELIVRGPIMKEYYRHPEATAEVIKDGWLYTGDIGRIDENMNVFITGRKKDMIIIKGQNIYSSDIETVLCRHPKVAEAAALSIPDELRGEIIGVAIVLKSGVEASEHEMKRFCIDHLANYKVPRQFFFVESLPGTEADKIDKEALRRHLSLPPVFLDTRTC
ncbi:MAG: AMP-binding protein [Chloroflexi bacterium]|nr:AMP-binding protein [Chloroflexota bacterium]